MPVKKQVLTEVHYMECVHPRNCRKDRVRENVHLTNAEFDCFTEQEAPVALIVKYYNSYYNDETDETVYECSEMPYRLANGKLYTRYATIADTDRLRMEPWDYKPGYELSVLHQDDEPFVPYGISKDLPAFDDSYAANSYASYNHMVERVQDMQSACIMVGNGLWRKALEPAYNIVGGGWSDSRWAAVKIAYQPNDETEYAYSAAEWDRVIEKVQKMSSRKMDFDHEDKIEVLIPEAVALPKSWENSDLQHGARAVKYLVKAMEELELFHKAEWLNASLCANETEQFLKKYLRGIVYRKQRGCGMLTEEQLEAATDSAYNDLMSRTKLIDY